jgi:hypothetical protein
MRLSVLESVAPTGLRGSQRPGLLLLPDGSDAHVDDALYLLAEWEFGYDDAQELVIASSLLELPDGRWAAKEIGVEEPRQNGKGETIEGRECLGLFYLDERKLIHSAHEFATASEALDRMDDRIGRNPTLKRRVKSVKRSHGEEGVYLKDGRKLLYKTRTKGGGRGFSADFLGMDEAMYIAEAFLGALMPVISARPNPQIWYMGSAVDQITMEHGIVFARLRERALSGESGRLAYFGWSAAYDRNKVLFGTPDEVPRDATADPAVIARANPALGIRIDLEHVLETEREAMDHRTFCVERLGVGDWPRVTGEDGAIISVKAWLALRDPHSEPADPLVFAFAVSEDRSSAAVAVAAKRDDGLDHVEVMRHKRGTGWVEDWLVERVERHQPAAVVCRERSPAASLIDNLGARGVAVESLNTSEYAMACGDFYDAVEQRKLRHLGTNELVTAIRGATRRSVGDAWAWDMRSSDVDISPLEAVTVALEGFRQFGDRGEAVFAFTDEELEAAAR